MRMYVARGLEAGELGKLFNVVDYLPRTTTHRFFSVLRAVYAQLDLQDSAAPLRAR